MRIMAAYRHPVWEEQTVVLVIIVLQKGENSMPCLVKTGTALTFALAVLCMTSPAAAQSATDDSENFVEDENYLRLGTADRHVTLAPFIQLDGGYADRSPGGGGWDARLRLARFQLFAQYDRAKLTFAYDSNNDAFPLRYAFVSYDISDALIVKVGQQDEPFSLQDYSGSRFLPFVEPGQSNSLIPGDNVGALVQYGGSNYSITAGVFGGDLNNGVGDKGVAVTGRVTWAPVYEQERIERGGDATSNGVGTQRVDDLLHLGAALSYRSGNNDSLSFSGSPETKLLTQPIATAPGFRDASSILLVNLEAARSVGSWSAQGEFTAAQVRSPTVNGTATGGYLYTTFFLTGERRGYSRSTGTFGRVIPKNPVGEGGFGAVEVGARADYLDLTRLGPNAGAQVGLTAVTNLYLTKRFLTEVGYTHTIGTAGNARNVNADAITFRFQYAY
ncbi:hypothetical protein DMC47_09235 [Nostoc sp. 3335mG]|nr:hypothetical protein DMC47_09235 [Nostoc sp. 3335mG]